MRLPPFWSVFRAVSQVKAVISMGMNMYISLGNERELYYETIGNGEDRKNLVFVHGSGCNRNFLRALAQQFPDFNCYLIDLPGHGKTPDWGCSCVEDYIDAVARFVSTLEHVVLVGHSLGGTICLGVSAREIPSLEKAVIISSGAKFDKLDERIHKMVKNWEVDWAYVLSCLGSFHSPQVLLDFFNFEKPDIILKDFKIDIELDIEEEMKKIHIPVLIMVGEDDILTIPEYSRRMKKAIAGSRLLLFPRCRHMLPIARRKAVAEAIQEFTCECTEPAFS